MRKKTLQLNIYKGFARWIERFNRSYRRPLKIRGAFPNEKAVLALITNVAIDKSDKQYNYPI